MSFLEYLYTDHAPIEEGDSMGILELANRCEIVVLYQEYMHS